MHRDYWSGGQYSLYRAALGAFVCTHFAQLLPYASELFAAGGLLASSALSPYVGALPNPLETWDTPRIAQLLVAIGAVCGVAVALGLFDRVGALLAALILGWLFQRNPLIANPSLPLLGWMLLLHACVPPRPYGSVAAKLRGGADANWRLPEHLHLALWVVLALAYSYSGYTKLFSPSWMSGESIRMVLENPLARDHGLRESVLALPAILLQLLTWGLLLVELLFAPLALFARLRPWLWLTMLLAQLGFLTFLNFADLTIPMLLAHGLSFDPRWLSSRVPVTPVLVLFDGDCAFCHASIGFSAQEDQRKLLRFAPLNGFSARAALTEQQSADGMQTIVVLHRDGREERRSRAVASILERLGGLWYLCGRLLRCVPRRVADLGYDLLGHFRYAIAGRQSACRRPSAAVSARLLR